MELRTLRYFLSVAHEGSITAAARTLYVTQPALSRQLRLLEEELGCELFVRKSRSVELTDKGRLLKQRAQEILDLAEKTCGELAPASGLLTGDVHIGMGESYSSQFVARAMQLLREAHPNVHFHVYDGNVEDLGERLDNGLLDFCVLIQPADLAKYNRLEIPERDRWGVLTRKDNPLAALDAAKPTDLAGERLIVSRHTFGGLPVRDPFIDWFGEGYSNLDIVGTYNLCFNATLMAAEGFGSVICLERQVRVDEAEVLRFVPLDPTLEVASDLVWKRHRLMSPAAEAFLDAIRDVLGASEDDNDS